MTASWPSLRAWRCGGRRRLFFPRQEARRKPVPLSCSAPAFLLATAPLVPPTSSRHRNNLLVPTCLSSPLLPKFSPSKTQSGFDNFAILRNDKDLAPLRQNPKFEGLLARFEPKGASGFFANLFGGGR